MVAASTRATRQATRGLFAMHSDPNPARQRPLLGAEEPVENKPFGLRR